MLMVHIEIVRTSYTLSSDFQNFLHSSFSNSLRETYTIFILETDFKRRINQYRPFQVFHAIIIVYKKITIVKTEKIYQNVNNS